jgi:hypothetical protein
VWVAPEVRLTSADIERAEAGTSGDPGRRRADGRWREEDGGTEHRNQQADRLILDGQVIWAPIIRMPAQGRLTGGNGGLTQEQVQRLLTSFSASKGCITVMVGTILASQ